MPFTKYKNTHTNPVYNESTTLSIHPFMTVKSRIEKTTVGHIIYECL